MSVYFVTAREVGRVKIGFSERGVRARFNSISTHSPVAVALEAVMAGDASVERQLHAELSEKRVRGEWFVLCPAIEALIEANRVQPKSRPVPKPGTIEAIIFKFGSASEFARRLRVPMTTVASWRQKGRIPAWRMEAITELLEVSA